MPKGQQRRERQSVCEREREERDIERDRVFLSEREIKRERKRESERDVFADIR